MRMERQPEGKPFGPLPDPYFDHLVEANHTFAEQIRTADQKAAYVFTFLLALLVWSADARHAFSLSAYPAMTPHGAAISAVFALAVLCALIGAITTIIPRNAEGGTSLYWGAWPAAGNRLAEARKTGDPAFLYDEYFRNAGTLAGIARSKYRRVAFTLWSLVLGVLGYGLLLATM